MTPSKSLQNIQPDSSADVSTGGRRLDPLFYSQHAEAVARQLLGMYLCRNINGKITRRIITETEAYYGEDDTACHARKGKTRRTITMYEAGGVAYIYLCYGIHHLLNVVTGPEGFPAAVLIRGLKGLPGPGRLTKALGITKDMNGLSLISSPLLWIEDAGISVQYESGKRIGIDYADPSDRDRLWRFTVI